MNAHNPLWLLIPGALGNPPTWCFAVSSPCKLAFESSRSSQLYLHVRYEMGIAKSVLVHKVVTVHESQCLAKQLKEHSHTQYSKDRHVWLRFSGVLMHWNVLLPSSKWPLPLHPWSNSMCEQRTLKVCFMTSHTKLSEYLGCPFLSFTMTVVYSSQKASYSYTLLMVLTRPQILLVWTFVSEKHQKSPFIAPTLISDKQLSPRLKYVIDSVLQFTSTARPKQILFMEFKSMGVQPPPNSRDYGRGSMIWETLSLSSKYS